MFYQQEDEPGGGIQGGENTDGETSRDIFTIV